MDSKKGAAAKGGGRRRLREKAKSGDDKAEDDGQDDGGKDDKDGESGEEEKSLSDKSGFLSRYHTTGEGKKLNSHDQDFWTHKAVKSHGGDKARVRSTIRLDPFNIKRALDPETWNSIRHMEGVVVESGNGRIHGYYSCVVCEDRLIFLPLSGTGFAEVIFREFGR